MADVIGLDILAMKKAAEQMQPYQRSDCPICGWTIETTADGIVHCKFCGWASENPIMRDVQRT